MNSKGCRSCLLVLFSFFLLLALHPAANAQQTTCYLDFPPGGAPTGLQLYAPWITGDNEFGNTNASHDPAYIIDTVTNGNSTVPNGTYLGWCLDLEDSLDGFPASYNALMFSSCDTNLDTELHALGLGYPGSVYVDPQVWNEINYLLNHKNGAYFNDIQIAIWNLIGGPDPDSYQAILAAAGTIPPYNTNEINALLSAATNNAANWQPECGNVVGAIVAILGGDYDPVQLTMIEVPYPCVPCINVTKQIACLQPTNNCANFGKTAYGLAGIGCGGIDQPGFCYKISVTNCGSVPLTNLVVSDNLMGLLNSSFVSNQSVVIQPGAGATAYFTMSFATNATNTVTVTADTALAQTYTNVGTNYTPTVVSNGIPVSGTDSAEAIVDTASISCAVTLYSPLDLDGNLYDNNVTLPAAAYYSSPPVVTLGVHVVNSGSSALTGVTITAPALAGFNCAMPPAFTLAAGASQDFQICLGLVTCPANLSFNLNVNAVVVPDTNHCAVYDLSSTNLIAVCSSCTGTVSCSTNCATANLSGAVVLQCSVTNSALSGDAGIAGVPVTLYGSTNNLLATNITDANGNYFFGNLAAGTYYVAASLPTNYIQTYPAGNTNSVIAVTLSPCTNVTNADFGYADVVPPMISVVPGANLGCNPTNLPTDASVSAQVTATTSCGASSNSVSYLDSTNGCLYTRTFTIVVTDTFGNTATTNVIYTWTSDTVPPVILGVPAGTNFGYNPSSVPTTNSVAALVSATDTCSPATISVTETDTPYSCGVVQIFTIVATNACGNMATAYVTNTWTIDTAPPILNNVPAGTNYGCNPTNLATASSIQSLVTASDVCSLPTGVNVSAGVVSTNGCLYSEIFTITATNAAGNSATAYVTNMWTVDTAPPILSGVPTSKNYGYNPTNLPTAASIQSAVTASDTCSPATVMVTGSPVTTNGCFYAQIFTILATNACDNMATAYVTNTWMIETTPPMLNGVPAGKNYGCNPTNLATASSIQSMVTASDTCSQATASVTAGSTNTNGCLMTQIFTITATNAAGNVAKAYVTNTWTVDTAPPVLSGVPANKNYGCNPTNVPTTTSVQSMVTASDTCSPATVSVTATLSTNGCAITQILTITATNACANMAKACVTNTWTVDTAPPVLSGVPASQSYGCNPTNMPTVATVQGLVTASDTCSPATVSVTAGPVSSNGCAMTQILTVTATNACGNVALAYVTNTWTADTAAPVLSGVPDGTNYGCNPTNLPTAASVQALVSASDTCSPATVTVNASLSTNSCAVTQVLTITATNACGNMATAYVTNTWTADATAPVLSGVPAGKSYGCNPTNAPTAASVKSLISASDTCSPATVNVTAALNTNGCAVTQVLTVIATNSCGNKATACVTNTWTSDITPPTLTGVPTGKSYGCNPTNIPTAASVQSLVTASDTCSPATVSVTGSVTSNGCAVTQVFTIIATNACGNMATAHVTNTWSAPPILLVTNVSYLTNTVIVTNSYLVTNVTYTTNHTAVTNITVTTNSCTNAICGNFNWQNPSGNNWLWCNAHISAAPGSNCAVTCQNSSITLSCNDGKVYTFPISNCIVNFSSSCTTGTNWFDGTTWHTTLPCSGDDQIFLQGCAIPWQSDFANCQSVCWTTTFTGTPGLKNCNWQWGAACYNGTAPSCGSVAPKACHLTSCPGGEYYSSSDYSGCPENYKPYCVGGGTGNGGGNCTGSWSSTGDICGFGLVTNKTVTTNTVIGTNTIVSTNTSTTPVTVVTTNVTVTTTTAGPALSGVPSGTYLGCNPTNIPTAASFGAQVTASATCSTASVYVTIAAATNGCMVTQIATITATNACGNSSTAYVTNTWTASKTPPGLVGVPAGGYIGCSSNNLPSDATLLAEISATDSCSSPTITVTSVDSGTNCLGTRLFTITATDACGNTTITNVAYTWTARTLDYCTNILCAGFNSQNPGTNSWLWCNAHVTGGPGQNCTLYCQNATVTLTCQNGKTYTYAVPNGIINFNNSCTTATNWFDGTNWNTIAPCSGDDEIFLHGCAIPWQTCFASCQNVCWKGVFSCTAPGVSVNWQWGAACYANGLPAYTNICPKACHLTSCPTGEYYSATDHAGCPENCKPYCVAGATGGGGANCTGSWSGTDTTCTFNSAATVPPVLNGVPASDYLGVNPTNIPTLDGVLALVSATDTCSPATVSGSVTTTSNGCNVTQIFTIVATNGCGNISTASFTNTWMTLALTNKCTNTICTSFNSQNPGGNSWLWCNSHLTGKPGNKDCWVFCTNATITLNCQSGKTFTFPVPNGQIHFSTNCTVGTNWFDGTNWNTVLPCGGDDEIFVQGCSIPWQADFANCQSVCWSGIYCCTVPGLNFNWQFGGACYNNQQQNYNSICPKACHQTPCQNGQYYNQNDHAGTPENCNPYCVGGGTGFGGSNCTGNFSNPGTCSF